MLYRILVIRGIMDMYDKSKGYLQLLQHETELKSVESCNENDILAADVYNHNGCKLLSANTMINPYLVLHLKLNRVKTIRVYRYEKHAVSQAIASQKSIQVYYNSVACIREIFKDLSAGRKLRFHQIQSISQKILQNCKIGHIVHAMRYVNQLHKDDEFTYSHSVNVSLYSMMLAKWLGLSQNEIALAIECGLMHDLGKSQISPELIYKKTPLTQKEFETIKNHTLLGYRLLEDSPEIDPAIKDCVLSHHERMNGSGYPYGVVPENIYTRIVAVADVYDAIISDRPYKKRKNPLNAFDFFVHQGAGLFDPRVFHALVSNMTGILIGSKVELSSGDTAKIMYISPTEPSRLVLKVNEKYMDLTGNENSSDVVQLIL